MTAHPTPASASSGNLGGNLLFSLGADLYCLEVARVKGVVAWAALTPSADERGLLGWLNLRGQQVPVVDLNQLVYGIPTERTLGARILLVECVSNGKNRMAGALASEVFALASRTEGFVAERFNPCDVLASILAGLSQ